MRLTNGCNAAWYEMNISSADDQVSPCCYYGGPRDGWSSEFRSLDDYWNSPNMQKVREINSGSEVDLKGGCEGCYFFGKAQAHRGEAAAYFPQFLTPFQDLSPDQNANWLMAIDDYENGRTRVKSTPLRFYINFGFACNLSCTMCHQVPRRKQLTRQVKADILLKWKPYLKAAIDVTVIGGEPFVLKEAIKFIQAFIEDPDFEPVQLSICTNGTLLDRHMDLLAKKRKLQLAVSLDTIGQEFEQIRIDADWKQIERNIFEFQATGKRLGYPWQVSAPCMLMKTNIPRLVDFAEWSIANDVQPGFYDFINAAGIEATHERENVVAHPSLLQEVPDWERHFVLAIDRLRHSKWTGAGEQLNSLYVQLRNTVFPEVKQILHFEEEPLERPGTESLDNTAAHREPPFARNGKEQPSNESTQLAQHSVTTDQQNSRLVAQLENWKRQVSELEQTVEARKNEIAGLHEQIENWQTHWRAVENSAGWRLLSSWRRARDGLAAEGTRRRRLYDSTIGLFRPVPR